MKIQQATAHDQDNLLALMREAHGQEYDQSDSSSSEEYASGEAYSSDEEWEKTEAAIITLLRDPLAGEAQLILDEADEIVGYMIMCRGFSLDYGGYFTWIEETYIQEAEQSRFRDQRFSP